MTATLHRYHSLGYGRSTGRVSHASSSREHYSPARRDSRREVEDYTSTGYDRRYSSGQRHGSECHDRDRDERRHARRSRSRSPSPRSRRDERDRSRSPVRRHSSPSDNTVAGTAQPRPAATTSATLSPQAQPAHDLVIFASSEDEERLIQERRAKRQAVLAKLQAEKAEKGSPEAVNAADERAPTGSSQRSAAEDDSKDALAQDDTQFEPADAVPLPLPPSQTCLAPPPPPPPATPCPPPPAAAPELDMFADTPISAVKAETTSVALQQVREDEVDDEKGYLKVVPGQVWRQRYEVTGFLGKGQFASVISAKDLQDGGRPVALKVIRANPMMLRQGRRELAHLRAIATADPSDSHACIRLLHHFEERSHLFMVFPQMEYNAREVLNKYGKGVGLSLRAVTVYARQLVRALRLLSQFGMLHCDIKPDNVLVSTQTNECRLSDFNSAAYQGEVTLGDMQSRFYRAPEVILGVLPTPAIDMWSLGATLFELFTGEILFAGRNNNEMLRLMLEADGPLPRRLRERGGFVSQYFNESGEFLREEADPACPSRLLYKPVAIAKATRDLRSEISAAAPKQMTDADQARLSHFQSFLERCLVLDPQRRLTPSEALSHPFLASS